MILALFLLMCAMLMSPRLLRLAQGLDRAMVVWCFAVALTLLAGDSLRTALQAVALDVLLLLFGVSLMAAYLRHAGLFDYLAVRVLARAGTPTQLLRTLVWLAGGLAALFMNDTVCIVLTPLVVALIEAARLPAAPYLFALAMGSNVGSMATLSGNPQNVLVGSLAGTHLTYGGYALIAVPLTLGLLEVTTRVLAWQFRAELQPRAELAPRTVPPHDARLTRRGLLGFALFVGLGAAGVPLAAASALAATCVLMIARVDVRPVLARVDWGLLVLFAAMFVATNVLARDAVILRALASVGPLLNGDSLAALMVLAGVTLVGSLLVSNVPLILVLAPALANASHPGLTWSVVAMISTLAGNATIFASVANLLVFEGAGPKGRPGLVAYLRISVPITLLTVLLGLLYLRGLHQAGLLTVLAS